MCGPKTARSSPITLPALPPHTGSLPFFGPFPEFLLSSPGLISIKFQNSALRWLKVVHAHQQNLRYRSRRSLHAHTPLSACTLSSCPKSGHPNHGALCPLLSCSLWREFFSLLGQVSSSLLNFFLSPVYFLI